MIGMFPSAVIVAALVAFFLCGYDKASARANRRRTPESVMLLSALVGGSVGLWAGMVLFRHKVRKQTFLWKFLAITLVQLGAAIVLAGPVP